MIAYRHATILAAILLLSACSVNTAQENSSLGAADTTMQRANALLAEAFISAFYSFDRQLLEETLVYAEQSKPSIVYYQGWARGGHYEIVNRMPCNVLAEGLFDCSVTVKDDHMKALAIDFNVTDTFKISIENGAVTQVVTRSNDLPVYREAAKWVRRMLPDLVAEPCQGFFNGGPTPDKCAAAMAAGYAKFAASSDFPLTQ